MRYTKIEERYVRLYYPHVSTSVIADRLNRSANSVYGKSKRMGLKKTDVFKAKLAFDRLGLKYSPVDNQESDCSYNVSLNGLEKLDTRGYVRVRLASGVWRMKHELIYEQHKGKIKEGYVITFDDCDKTNYDINNLVMVTKAEILRRNRLTDSAIMKLDLGLDNEEDRALLKKIAPEIIAVKRNQLILNKQIYERRRNKKTG